MKSFRNSKSKDSHQAVSPRCTDFSVNMLGKMAQLHGDGAMGSMRFTH